MKQESASRDEREALVNFFKTYSGSSLRLTDRERDVILHALIAFDVPVSERGDSERDRLLVAALDEWHHGQLPAVQALWAILAIMSPTQGTRRR